MLISFFYLINCQIPEYKTTLINFGHSKYFIINFTMAKIIEMNESDRNKVVLLKNINLRLKKFLKYIPKFDS